MVKKWIWRIVAGFLLLLLFTQINVNELQISLRQIHWTVISGVFLLQIVTQLLLNLQWYQIAKFAATPISFWRMFYINSQGSVMEAITPGVKVGGEITRAVQISRLGNCTASQAAVIVALQKIFSLSAFFLINVFSIIYLSNQGALIQAKSARLTITVLLASIILFFMLIFLVPKRILSWIPKKENAIYVFFNNLLEHIILFEKQKTELIAQFLLALLIWLLYPLKLYLLVIQVQPGLSLVYIVSVTFISYMIAMLPLFPGGLGGFEGTMTGLLTGLGLSFSSAAILAVIFRFITFWFVLLASVIYIGFYKVSRKIMYKERMLPDE